MDSTVSVVLVTNVGQGFGRAIALAYGQADFDVVCADKDVDLAAKTAAEIEELGGQAIPIAADMTTQLDVQNAFEKVYEIFGDLSGVVHVAPFESHTRFRDLAEGEFAELLDETFKSSFLTLKTAARMLSRSWLVLVAPPLDAGEPHMAAMRGAVAELARAFDARYESLRVNVVVPSRSASDPVHNAALVASILHLSTAAGYGVSGQELKVKLPPPPRLIESLLPEVQAALNENTRQDDLEASLYDEESEDEEDAVAGATGSVADSAGEGWEPSGDGEIEDDEEEGFLQRVSYSGKLPRDSY
jgi:NAD(P)-dependent dehydrogenase (short-subunit alcohol dehydrogenase family)